jgi:cytochrome P450
MTERTGPDWDPRDPSVLGDQQRAYDEMRARCPVAHSDFLGWSLFTHRDVVEAVRDTVTFSSATKRRAIPNGMDPPEHTVYRQLLNPFFTSERMAAFEPRSREIASALLGPILARGEAEFISEFAGPFPHQALCAFVGWPVADWNRVRGWTHGNQEVAFRQDRAAGAVLAREFSAYVTEILNARRSGVGRADDLMGELLWTVVGGGPLRTSSASCAPGQPATERSPRPSGSPSSISPPISTCRSVCAASRPSSTGRSGRSFEPTARWYPTVERRPTRWSSRAGPSARASGSR